MKTTYKTLIFILISVLPSFAFGNTSAYESLLNYRSGFGQNVTGGAGGKVVIIENLNFQELKDALTGDEPKWIRFAAGLSGEINIEETLYIGSNKTIDGRGADITFTSPNDCDGILFWGKTLKEYDTNRRNLIVHNVKIKRMGNGDNCGQGLGIAFKAQDIWVDHVTFSQNGDESLSMGKGATNLTASWCKFIDTDKAILLGWSDGDDPKKERALDENMKVTVHHSFFDQVNGRTPMLTYGKAHFYNNFQRDWNWAAATSYEWGQLYSENNIYAASSRSSSTPAIDTTHLPRWYISDGYAKTRGDVFLSPNNKLHTRGSGINTGKVFSPQKHYHYKLDAPNHRLRKRLIKYAGWSKNPKWPRFETPKVITHRISASSDDAQESIKTNGLVDIDNPSLQLTLHPNGAQKTGLRFTSVAIKSGSIITRAWIQFTTKEPSCAVTQLTLHAEKNTNAENFTDTDNNISNRSQTSATINWEVEPWNKKNETGIAQRTPNIASLIQEVINQENWESGSPIVFMISGDGLRKAYSWDGNAKKAPVLHIEYLADTDSDGTIDINDNCVLIANKNQFDTDGDGKGNSCDTDDDNDRKKDSKDNCPLVANNNQIDTDGDGYGNACDLDDDGDGIADTLDNCPLHKNANQLNIDKDGKGDACDNTPAIKEAKDSDGDGIADITDNCPAYPNPKQLDTDRNGKGNLCDNDNDGDYIADYRDNCALKFNFDQLDTDKDGMGDVCDKDDDNDDINDSSDNCPLIHNKSQKDKDDDKIGDACDDDDDNDNVSNNQDNCPNVPNEAQANADDDKRGNACDSDDDNDKVVDSKDNCPLNKNTNQQDTDKDGQGDVCDPSPNGGKDPILLDRNIVSGDDDAEEYNDDKGRVIIWGKMLDMVKHSSGDQLIGLRYTNITIPENATIKAAWLQFTAKEIGSESTKLIIKGEKHINPASFTSSDHNISSRKKTSAAVTWSPSAWVKKNDSSKAQRSTDITAIIQEIIEQKGWKPGNALSLIISGSGHRGAYTKNSDDKKAAKLHIEYIEN